MTKPKDTCAATIDLVDGRALTCAKPAGHPGPLHESADGEHWGDGELPAQPELVEAPE
jgi:hypothetical protein